MTAVRADTAAHKVMVTLPREAMASLLTSMYEVRDDFDGVDAALDEWTTAKYRADLPARELSDLYDLTRDEADNRLSEALDVVLGLLPPTVWTMTGRQAWALHDALYGPASQVTPETQR